MQRFVSSVTRPASTFIYCLPYTKLSKRRISSESFLNDASLKYIDAMYKQWSKDPNSVHEVIKENQGGEKH